MGNQKEVSQECFKRLIEMVREVSLTRFRQSSLNNNFQITDLPSSDPKSVYNHWMSLILVSGKALRVTFKVHFDIKTCKKVAAPIYGKEIDEIELRQAQDFMKEFCNLSAGFIKKVFEEQKVEVGISLPLVIRGFDEVFFNKQKIPNSNYDRWELGSDGNNFVCTSYIEVYDEDSINNINFVIEEEEEEEIDFL